MSLDLLFGCPKAQVRATHIFILINDLMIDCRVHKFVDDTTLTETLLTRPNTSKMHTYIDQL